MSIAIDKTPTAKPPPGPRNRYPGQLLFRFRRQPLEFLSRLAREYGDVVHFPGIGVEYFFINHPDYIRDVLVTEADRFSKGPALQRAKATLGEGLLTSDGEFHKRQRRLAQPVFHARRVETYADEMVAQARRMRERWRDGQVLDIHQQMMELALEVVGAALFGADVAADARQIGEAMTTSVRMFNRALMPWGPLLARLPLLSNIRFWRARRLLFDTIQSMVEARRSQPLGAREDFLSLLLRARDAEGDGGTMTDAQLRDEAITIFTAGHETTANALTFAWYLLARHPEAERRLHAEIDAALGQRLPTANDLPRLPYTRMVFAEAMRLYPPAWAIGRRALADWRAGDYLIPGGGVVLMSQWVMHRDPRYWMEPLSFRPERWEPDQRSHRPRYAYFPFGGGPRQCIGEPFAWLEGVLLIATIAQHWRLELQDDRELTLEPTITLRPRDGVGMIARARRAGA